MAVVPTRICELVETFDRHIEAYHSQQYNETQLRREFIDPFFDELGWDVSNKAGYAQAYKDVIHEDAIKIGGATKAPDYCFRIGGARKFFLEAKKPSVDIKGDPHPAYQLRRYAWSAKLPLSVLTDFEELAVYDCQMRPKHTDKADVARIMLFTYKDYLKNWFKIAEIFSKDAILKGSFDKFAAATKGKRGTSTVDKEFLAEIEKWRNMLARIIALRNRTLSVREINFSVQRTIDRILFLRMCEDRGIESYGQLQSIISGDRTYPRLCEIFEKADQKYNSGLFHFHDEPDRSEGPDELTPNIIIDDKDLKWILYSLYYPQSPYEFSVLPAEILGNVYEQFLGKVITLTTGHRANVEDKPEVKKAGGVYYTPSYIVDYIVKNTVGKLLGDYVIPSAAEESIFNCHSRESGNPPAGQRLTPRQVSNIKILDPACGSGSFLIGAYQHLLDWHLKYYTENEPEKHAKGKNPKIFETNSRHSERSEESQLPHYGLTITEKKRILINNIFGVDIDSQAVEVTKLSLLLKVLEGESSETIDNQYRLFHERALPDLADNIKCGNSLIGPDFYDNFDPSCHSRESGNLDGLRDKINAFDWHAEFSEIFSVKNPGFDVVIGNPPWGATYTNPEKLYLKQRFHVAHVRTPESFNYFVCQMRKCARENGIVGCIIPSSFLKQHEFWKTRKYIVDTSSILRVCNLGDSVFHKVTAPSCILVFFTSREVSHVPQFIDLRRSKRETLPDDLLNDRGARHAKHMGKNSESYLFQIHEDIDLMTKCYKWPTLKDVAEEVATGISSGLDKAFVYDPSLAKELKLEPQLLRKLVLGREVDRYTLKPTSQKQIIYLTPDDNINEYPNTKAILLPFRIRLMRRREAANGKIPWYSLNWPRRRKLFDKKKLLIRQTSERIRSVLDENQWYALKSIIIIQIPNESSLTYEYLMALLNSNLMHFLYDDLVGEQSRVFPEVKPVQLFKLPIRLIDFNHPEDKAMHDKIVKIVEQMLDLHKKVEASKTPDEKTRLQRQIDTTDSQINKLVYELYGLTDEEIKTIEE